MTYLLGLPKIGGFFIWLWKKYIKKDKTVDFTEERDNCNGRAWLMGLVVLGLFFLILVVVFKIFY